MNSLITNYEIFKIKEIISETSTIKTFIFDWEIKRDRIPIPGQFVMIWNFSGIQNEKAMSLSMIDIENNKIGVTVKKVGVFTKELHNLSVGDKLGIRGPYGNGFVVNNLENKKIIAIGGGVGMAPISCFISHAKEKGANVDLVCASRTKDELIFPVNFESKGSNIFTCTDDGTCGFKGFAYDRTIELLKNRSYDMGVVCGPELMMKGIFELLEDHDIPTQYSIERYMKCAIGLCGQCCVDNTGWRVCIEGPVFSNKDLKKITEFGKYYRNAFGIKKSFI
jgi:dihydroorotate dehydrogenase electron transfer subunit